MRPDTSTRLCESALLETRETQFARLDALFNGVPLTQAFVLQGIVAVSDVDPYQDPERWVDESLDDLSARAEEMLDPHVFRPLVVEFGPYGVHFVDRILGCRVYQHEGQWWSDHLDTPIGQLRLPDLARDDTWRLARAVASAFVAHGVTVPLFGLPTIASSLNVLVNLYSEAALVAMMIEPQAVRHDLLVINGLLCALHRWYQAHVPSDQLQPVVAAGRCQPRGLGQLCGCTTHLLSVATYRDLIADLDDELLRVYANGGMIHLCGRHVQHVPTWRGMRSVRAVQINDRAAQDLPLYFEHLRDDQIIYLNPTPTMPIERAMEITGGRRLVIVADIDEPLPTIGGL